MKDKSNVPSPEPGQPSPGREEAIFGAALLLSSDQRATFLKSACGEDLQLRERVEMLLQADSRAGAFLEPALPAPDLSRTRVDSVSPSEKPGDVIGRYKIREKLGEGGCGAVYVAEQAEPVRRRVALKVIKLGMDTRSVIARFEAERQALAMMDHPNIARVLDAGATETGRPYFVMELVRGIKITDYCDQNHLDTSQRLELFIQVCHAVQHAHQKGIIHRDLKPSNILVTLHDGVPVPKVIDFGVAKATEGRLTDLTVYTEMHQFIGTPAYMSPEQAEMSGLDVDTRSDIYSLGVLLYELLTGKPPFDPQELLQSGLDQMRKTIREKEPVRPSTRLNQTLVAANVSSLKSPATGQPVTEEQARADSRRLLRLRETIALLRGDLDWIVMRALEKDRTRRFETASALAADVRRFLKNEPVEARPPTTLYRFGKMVRRNKTAVAAVGAVAAALVLGLGLSLFLFVKEREAFRRAVEAEKQEAVLRKQAEAGLALERRMREMAPIGEKLSTAGLLMSQGQFDKAEELVSQVPPIFPQSAVIYNVLGMVHACRGEFQAAITNYSKSIETDPTNALAHHSLAPLLARTGDSEAYGRHRERILSRFSETADPAVAGEMALDCLILPPAAQAFKAITNLVGVAAGGGPSRSPWESIGFVQGLADYRQGDFVSAARLLQTVVAQEGDLNRTVGAYMVMAMAHHRLKQTDQARAALAKGLEIAQSRPRTPDNPRWNDQMTADLLAKEAQHLIRDETK